MNTDRYEECVNAYDKPTCRKEGSQHLRCDQQLVEADGRSNSILPLFEALRGLLARSLYQVFVFTKP